MEDPTGGMWIYFIFFLIPLVRIIPRLLRRMKNKNSSQPQSSFFSQLTHDTNDTIQEPSNDASMQDRPKEQNNLIKFKRIQILIAMNSNQF